ncbi:hypothetical protein EDM58_16155 [Brevibacillus panacihumi]|uniref:Uncharacterized protein n=1 Tax=Brevibacillus panacihumi TaxID=497735 RepID=A0A3M8CQI4_9BACL|nr:hypothetical protein EDM58_16155 [Brevibacillus panacihumi]
MGPIIGFAILLLIAVICYLAVERLIERSLKIKSFLVTAVLKTIVLVIISMLFFQYLPIFGNMFP